MRNSILEELKSEPEAPETIEDALQIGALVYGDAALIDLFEECKRDLKTVISFCSDHRLYEDCVKIAKQIGGVMIPSETMLLELNKLADTKKPFKREQFKEEGTMAYHLLKFGLRKKMKVVNNELIEGYFVQDINDPFEIEKLRSQVREENETADQEEDINTEEESLESLTLLN